MPSLSLECLNGTRVAVGGEMGPRILLSAFLHLVVLLHLVNQPLSAAVREIATISTNFGDMEFELFPDVSPRAVANFKYLADTRFYDSSAFHRHIAGFMVQGGDPLTRGTTADGYNQNVKNYGMGGPEYTIPDEPTTRSDRAHVRGVLSMAKTKNAHSGGSQFFIMFGSADDLNDLHAPLGRLVSGGAALDAIEAQQKHQRSDLPMNLPVSPILIGSVRIRAERTLDEPPSRLRFQQGTVSGLLRGVERSRQAFGNFQITVTSGGAFSAQVQYFGRRNVFTGLMAQAALGAPEAEYSRDLDVTDGVPLRVRFRARRTSASTTNLVVSVGGINADGSDRLDATLGVASVELGASLATLGERYTAAFDSPWTETAPGVSQPQVPGMRSPGCFLINVRPLNGLALILGRLQDNTVVSAARHVANEGGRGCVPLLLHELQPNVESLRPEARKVPLADWSDKYFSFLEFRMRLVANFELPRRPNLPQPSTVADSYVIWYREPVASGAVTDAIATFMPVFVAAWTSPSAGQTLAPFSPLSKGQLTFDSTTVGSFRVAGTNTAAVFDPANSLPHLRFNPVDGSFKGSFWDNSGEEPRRRTFQGVLLQKAGINRGVGFSITEKASVPVVLIP